MSDVAPTPRAVEPPEVQRSAVERPGFHLRRRPRRFALLAHVLSSVGWFGIALVVAFEGIVAAATDDPHLPLAMFRAIQIAPWLTISVGVVAAATGLVLGLGTRYGVVTYWWVVLKIVITAAVVVTDAVLVTRVAGEAVASGRAPTALFGSTIAHVVMLCVATVLSVLKPGGRMPWAKVDARTGEAVSLRSRRLGRVSSSPG